MGAPKAWMKLLAAMGLALALAVALAAGPAAADEFMQPALGLAGSLLVSLREASPTPVPVVFDVTNTCAVVKLANAVDNKRTCAAIGKGQALVIDGYRSVCLDKSATGVGTQLQPPTKNPDNTAAPSPLQQTPLRSTFGVPSSFGGAKLTSLQSKEGGTWGFLWQSILNLYYLHNCCKDYCGGNLTALLVPNGFTAVGGENGFSGVTFLQQQPPQDATDGPLPYASAFRSPDALVLAVRGTGAEVEWLTNFDYKLVDGPTFAINGGATRRIPGRVHAGFASIFTALWPKLLPAVNAAGIKRVYVTGHSQGANVAAMVAYAANELLAQKAVSGRGVDAVLFGVPLGGDSSYVSGIAKAVEIRSISYEADVVSFVPCAGSVATLLANMPACGSPPALVSTLTAPLDLTFIASYTPHRGAIKVTPSRLPAQQAAWADVKLWTAQTAERKLLAAHVCALTCFVATNSKGFNGPDRCLLDGPDADGRTSCFPPEFLKLLPGAKPEGNCPQVLGASSSSRGLKEKSDGCPTAFSGGELPVCSADVMADTQKWIVDFTNNRKDLQTVTINFQGSRTVSQDPFSMRQISRAALLPCDPNILPSTAKIQGPLNVRTVLSVMPLITWNTLILPKAVGAAEGNGPPPTGFADPAASYRMFVNLAARWPFFCGEQGDWPTLEDACRRSLVSLFAHAAQETGNGENYDNKPPWQTLFQYTREQNCYFNPGPCKIKYNTGTFTEAYGAPPDAVFFGRGGHQLTYVYNYASISPLLYGDFNVLVQEPDRLVQDSEGVLGSAIFYFMTTAPPKPSMHDVLIGAYKLAENVAGMTADADGAVYDRFMATHSIINGGVECSPPPGPDQAFALQASKNRYIYYLSLLPLFGVSPGQETPWEKSYVPNVTYCTITFGNPWADNPPIRNQPYFYYYTDKTGDAGTECTAIGYEPSTRPRLSLVPPNQQALCVKLANAV